MIRDPSDGSVKEKSSVDELPSKSAAALEYESNSSGLIVSTTLGLSIIEDIKAAILAGKVNPERLSTEWVYQRAWNDALDFALTQIGRVEKSGFSPSTM